MRGVRCWGVVEGGMVGNLEPPDACVEGDEVGVWGKGLSMRVMYEAEIFKGVVVGKIACMLV